MPGFSTYQIAKSGLYTNERAMYVTGQNLSNVNTTGYTRQQALMKALPSDKNAIYPTGRGSTVEETRQIRNVFLDNVFRAENEQLGYQEARQKTYSDIESIIGEPMTDGLQSVLNDFWNSWEELSKTPESLTTRALVRQRAEAFVTQVNHIGDQLNKLQEDLNSEIKVDIDKINTLAENIADLNNKILKAESNGDNANDYRDQRANYIDTLSNLVNINVNERQNGTVDVDIGGHFLVSGSNPYKMYAGQNVGGSTFIAPRWELTDQLVNVTGGTLKGLLEARGEDVVGATSSVSNGSPSAKADITFAIDLSDDTFGAANLQKIKDNIASYLNELDKKGIDYRLNLITFGGSAGADTPQQFANRADFESAVSGLSTRGGTDNDFFSVVNELKNNVTYRNDTNKYLLVFTGEDIQGDAVNVDANTLNSQINTLNGIGMTTSVVTRNSYAGDANPDPGWQTVVDNTDGNIFDLNTYNMTTLADDADRAVNAGISTVPESNNIIANIRSKLNALVNIIAREINSFHTSGIDKDGNVGEEFFKTIDSDFPLQMGNIKLNPNFEELDKLVASKTNADGDNTMAQDILDLRGKTLFGKKAQAQNIDDFYRSVILALGNDARNVQRQVDGQKQLVDSAQSQKNATSAVSMDEEMSNMIKYQYSYDAASRFLTLIDSCMEQIINKLGTQGR